MANCMNSPLANLASGSFFDDYTQFAIKPLDDTQVNSKKVSSRFLKLRCEAQLENGNPDFEFNRNKTFDNLNDNQNIEEELVEEEDFQRCRSDFDMDKFLLDEQAEKSQRCKCDWIVQRQQLSQQLMRDENLKLKQTINSTKTLMNMVIHDLRSPCSQIKFSMMLALQRFEELEAKQALLASILSLQETSCKSLN